jgi:molybdopterin converting factor subunit 1
VNVRIRLFAILRERAGAESIELSLEDDATVADALRELKQRGPLADLLAGLPVLMAVNRDYASPATRLRADDELALIPPVSGGAARGAAWCGGACCAAAGCTGVGCGGTP